MPEREKLRVLHVVPYYPPYRIGGLGQVVAHLHASLLKQGHASRVLTAAEQTTDPNVVLSGRSALGFALSCWRHLGEARTADVVHIHHGEGILLVILMKLFRIRTPVLLTLHASNLGISRSIGPFRFAGRRFPASADTSGSSASFKGFVHRTIIVRLRHLLDVVLIRIANETSFISRSAARDHLGAEGGNSAIVIHNSVPPATEAPLINGDPDPVDLLFVGTGSARKRVLILPYVLSKLQEKLPTATLRIVGPSAEQDSPLQRLARELGVAESLILEGSQPSFMMERFFRASRVLILPSIYEGLPMVLLEALRAGLPCVATDVSGHPEAIRDGREGFLVPPDDAEAMAEAALRILTNPDLEREMADAAEKRVARLFGPQAQSAKHLELYRDLVREARR